MSDAEFSADKESLLRMLTDFEHDRPRLVAAAAAAAASQNPPADPFAVTPSPDPAPITTATTTTTTTTSSSSSSINGASPTQPPAAAAAASGGSSSGSSNGGVNGAVAPIAGLATADQEVIARGMSAVMAAYEDQLKSPIRHLIAGDLARTLLIQVSPWNLNPRP